MLQHSFSFFFFNDTATTEIYTLSLHDALPIFRWTRFLRGDSPEADDPAWAELRIVHADVCLKTPWTGSVVRLVHGVLRQDRKSTRLNSSHSQISYAVFCLKKKKI